MPKFSRKSLIKLDTCDLRLQILALAVVQNFDCTVIFGHRGEKEQNEAYCTGNSKLKFPQSKHNSLPSMAIDLAPYIAGKGIIWKVNQCYYFAGYVMRMANELNIPIRWGGDWDMDGDVNDQNFNDLVHFEIK